LNRQLWATLPAFCHWSLDTAQAFPSLAKEVRLARALFFSESTLRCSCRTQPVYNFGSVH
jgi:hypothetical protein